MLRTPVFMGLLSAGLALPLAAQSESDKQEVLKPIVQLFDAMRQRDSLAARAVFAPQARMVGVQERDGQVNLRYLSPDDFARAVGAAPTPPWDERIYDPEVRVDGRVATVWVKYDFLAGDKWSHCGIDAFQLVKLADGWKITQLADTRQTTGCKTPAAPKP